MPFQSTTLTLAAAFAFAWHTPALADQPNILFIYLDDFGWRDTGYMGSDFFETPNLDQLASEGLVFTDAYSCAANCTPARACLLSGLYTPRHKIFNVGTRARGNAKFRRLEHVPGVSVLDSKITTWAQRIQAAGYKTAHLGKWHLSDDPIPYGFDINIGGTKSGSPPRGYYPPHNAPGLRDAPENEYLTDRLSDDAVRFIRDHRDRPWLLYLTHFAVHTPLDAKRELVRKYQQKRPGDLHRHVAMATMIQAVDDGVGKIVDTLRTLGIEKRTIVIFYSDNGGYGGATDMAPLRGYKGTYYEGGIRVPLFVKWPGVVSPGKSSIPIIGVDLYPTLCEMAGVELGENQAFDGESLVPLLKSPTTATSTSRDRAIFWHFPAYLQASGRWKSESRDPLFRTRPCSIIRKGKWKLHHYFEDDGLELYNLQLDVGERDNLAGENKEIADRLLADLTAWREEVGAPIPERKNRAFDPQAERLARQKLEAPN